MINISEITKFFFSNPVIVRASIYSAVLTLCPGLAPLRREQVKQLSVNEDRSFAMNKAKHAQFLLASASCFLLGGILDLATKPLLP